MRGIGDPRSSLTIVVGLISAIFVLALVVLAQVLFFSAQRDEDQRKFVAVKPQELADLQAQQLAQISSYRYISQKDGVVAIPIDQAIERYAAEMKAPWDPTRMKLPDTRPADTQPQGASQ